MICEHLTPLSQCLVAERLAGVPCEVNAALCDACSRQSLPRQENPVTASVAITIACRDRGSGICKSAMARAMPLTNKPPPRKKRRKKKPKKHDCLAGSELTTLLHYLGYEYTPDCQCRKHADRMDREGCGWCRQNLKTIVGWMEIEAAQQGKAFSKFAARRVVRLAIVIAERKQRKRGKEKTAD